MNQLLIIFRNSNVSSKIMLSKQINLMVRHGGESLCLPIISPYHINEKT